MLHGYKPWQKAFFDNFLIILSILVTLLIRIANKMIKPEFSIYNLLAFGIAIIGFGLLVYSKREQLKRKEFFKFGVSSESEKDRKIYKIGYFFLILGLLLTFII